jgi:hypothetical protein
MGVEKMNSVVDKREAFFRSKVKSLMAMGSVMKSFNKPKEIVPEEKPEGVEKPIKAGKEDKIGKKLKESKVHKSQSQLISAASLQ